MNSSPFAHLVGGHIIPPLLRPLPALFVCAEQCASRPETQWPPVLHEVYRMHRACLLALLQAATEMAGLSPADSAALTERVQALPEGLSLGLPKHLDALDLELAHFSEVHRAALRQAYNMHPEVFRATYHKHVPPWRVALLYSSTEDEQAPKLMETLSERCYYRTRSALDVHLAALVRWADFVVFAPRPAPLNPEVLALLRRNMVPFVVLVNLGSDVAGVDMEQARLAALYQRNEIPILHRPFPPLRLFQRIDRDLLLHRVQVSITEAQVSPVR